MAIVEGNSRLVNGLPRLVNGHFRLVYRLPRVVERDSRLANDRLCLVDCFPRGEEGDFRGSLMPANSLLDGKFNEEFVYIPLCEFTFLDKCIGDQLQKI